MPAAEQVVDGLGAVCFASALASIFILHRLAKADPGKGRADAPYLVRYMSLLGRVAGLSPSSARAPADRRDIRTVRVLYLVFAVAAGAMAWSAAPLLRVAIP
ncbi:hypothetical protein [Frateuria sp. YIM B11624]|uniref:hypothetical protein n=1 Tax=Frateuria sp. YIM B11624 TaxID=3143185 RepID=UPI003C71F72F